MSMCFVSCLKPESLCNYFVIVNEVKVLKWGDVGKNIMLAKLCYV